MKKTLLLALMTVSISACSQEPAVFNTYGVEKGAGSVGVHTVLPGDTVYTIAQNYQLPIREIITLNNIQAPYILNTGYRMKLPPPNEHLVGEGDTVETIAHMYEISPSRLVQLNSLQPPYNLPAGQSLRLPTSEGQRATVQNAVIQNIVTQGTTPPQAQGSSTVTGNPVQTARLGSVDREALNTQSSGVVEKNNSTLQEAARLRKPEVTNSTAQQATVQKASVNSKVKIPKSTPKLSGAGKYMRPVDGKVISNFGPKANGLMNDGINIKAARGSPVRAAENGVVVYNGDDLEGYGNLVLIRHENKIMSAYAHLDKTLIKRGAKVVRGQSIGTVGSTGQVDTPQLHFEIRKGSTPLDPNKYL